MNPMACWTSSVGVSLASETGHGSRGDFPMACMAAASAGAWSPGCGTWVLASVSSLLPSREQRQCSQQEVEGGSVDTRSIKSPAVSEPSKDSPCPDSACHPVQTVPGLSLGFCPFPLHYCRRWQSGLQRNSYQRSAREDCLCICLQKVGSRLWNKQSKCRI